MKNNFLDQQVHEIYGLLFEGKEIANHDNEDLHDLLDELGDIFHGDKHMQNILPLLKANAAFKTKFTEKIRSIILQNESLRNQ